VWVSINNNKNKSLFRENGKNGELRNFVPQPAKTSFDRWSGFYCDTFTLHVYTFVESLLHGVDAATYIRIKLIHMEEGGGEIIKKLPIFLGSYKNVFRRRCGYFPNYIIYFNVYGSFRDDEFRSRLRIARTTLLLSRDIISTLKEKNWRCHVRFPKGCQKSHGKHS